jgi:hypothetical protein
MYLVEDVLEDEVGTSPHLRLSVFTTRVEKTVNERTSAGPDGSRPASASSFLLAGGVDICQG